MTTKKKVFLVEDDEVFTFLVENRIKQMTGVELSTFSLGQDCLERLPENPDVVFLDYSLPVMDGLQILKRIKSDQPETTVVMLSGLEWKQVIQECMDSGAEDFIQKDSTVAEQVHDKLIKLFGKEIE